LVPLALLGWAILCPVVQRLSRQSICDSGLRWQLPVIAPLLTLLVWYGYHYSSTGYVFGNPEFFRYNVESTIHPLRILLALILRVWQVFGYLHLWVLTLLMTWAMTRPALQDGEQERPRIAIPVQFVFGVVMCAYIAAMAIVGGAVLARYMLPVVPLVIILAISTLRRRIRSWRWLVLGACVAFAAGLFLNPPYGFSPEDNLAYRDYILMHEDAERFLEGRMLSARVLTAWPASDELSRPFLGYVTRPLRVVRIENFTVEEILSAAEQRSRFDVALLFSTKYEPPYSLLENWALWQNLKSRFFDFHRDLPPEVAAQLLGGRVIFKEKRQGQWVAIIELERVEDASVWRSTSVGHEVAGVSFHDQPDFPSDHQLQRVSCRQGQVRFHFESDIHSSGDNHVSPHQGHNFPGKQVSGAESLWATDGEKNVACPNPDPQG
jgi:hypothetical protein